MGPAESIGPKALITSGRQRHLRLATGRGNLGLDSRFSGCVEDGGEAGRAREPLSPAWGLTSGLEGMNRRKPAAGGRQEHRPKDARKGQKDV